MSPTNSVTSTTAFDVLDDEIQACLAELQDRSPRPRDRRRSTPSTNCQARPGLAELRKDLQAFEKRFGRLIESRAEPPGELRSSAGVSRRRRRSTGSPYCRRLSIWAAAVSSIPCWIGSTS